jgi:hypothetical protein
MSKNVIHYYRADTPAVREAWEQMQKARDAVHAEGDAFAALFEGATAMYTDGSSGLRFHGLTFDPPMPADIWTKPTAKDGYVQQPRAKGVFRGGNRANADRAAELRRVHVLYADHRPRASAKVDQVFRELGTDWGTMWICGYAVDERNGVVFVATGATLGHPCVEITASQYEAAVRQEKSHG